MKNLPSLAAATALLLTFPRFSPAADAELTPTMQFSTGLAGGQNKLMWHATPGTRYRILSSTDLSHAGGGSGGTTEGGWRERAMVDADGPDGVWLDPEPAGPRVFYQIEPPQPEVFSVEPAVLSPGRVLTIRANSLPAGSSVVFEIEGIPPVTAPIVTGPDGRMTVTLPAFDIITQPGSGAGPHVKLVRVTGPNGATVCVIGQTFEVTPSGFAGDAPPIEPPAAPSFYMAVKEKGLPGSPDPPKKKGSQARLAPGGDATEECDDGNDCDDSALVRTPNYLRKAKTSEAKNTIGAIARRGALTGEVRLQECDLILAVPAGPPLAWVRTYRSMVQNPSDTGKGWDHGYGIHIRPINDSPLLTEPTRMAVSTGDGRVEVLQLRSDGTYAGDGIFHEIRVIGLKKYGLFFADQGSCAFHAFDGSPLAGTLESMTDRNGVTVTCSYTAAGLLSSVSSQFGQTLTISRDASNRVATVADGTGRFVRYTYYGPGEPGGNEGDLKSVSCPQKPGQAPVRGDVVYRYTSSSTDSRLSSNLISMHDGAGRLMTSWTYSSATNPLAADYDRCVMCDRWALDPADPVAQFSYEFVAGAGGGAGGLLCIENDEAGRVTEVTCDRMYRPMTIRWSTTAAVAGVPVTSTTNRPPGPPNAADPAFLEMSFVWNPDHSCTRCTEPDGLQTRTTYDRDLRRDCPVRERGNARVVTLRNTSGEERTVTMDYLPGFGTATGDKVRRVRAELYCETFRLSPGSLSGGGSVWAGEDGDGGCTNGVCGSPIGGLSIKGGRNPGGNIAGRMAGGDRDEDCDGRADNEDWSAVRPGNPIPSVRPVVKSNFARNSLSGVANNPLYEQSGNSGENPLYDGGDDFRTRLVTTHGQVFTQTCDSRGNCLSRTTPVPGSGITCTWNSLGQCTSVTILNGPGSSFRDELTYDAATGWRTGYIHDKSSNGTGLKITHSCVRDNLGRITSLTNPRGFTSLISYNTCDQIVTVSSPPVGTEALTAAGIVTTQYYDAGGLPVRLDVEHRDAAGILVASNPVLTQLSGFDARGRLVQIATEQKPVEVPPGVFSAAAAGLSNFDVTDFTLNAACDCVRVSKPAECRDQPVGAVCDLSYNALGQISSMTTGGMGMPGAVTTEYHYSAFGAVVWSRKVAGGGEVSPTVTCAYDQWRRELSYTDEMGNVTNYTYAENGFVTTEVYGEVEDVAGSAGNVLLARDTCRNSIRVGGEDGVLALSGMRLRTQSNAGGASHFPESSDPGAGLSKLTPKISKESHGKFRLAAAFFDVCVTDDESTRERFAPGEPAPHATETTVVHRSPSGLPLSVTRNGDYLYLFGGYDTAGRLVSWSQPGAVTATATLDACGNMAACTLTAHSTTPGAPDETFSTTSTFDPLNQRVSSTDSAGNTDAVARDSVGRITSHTSPGGLTMHCDYSVMTSAGFVSSTCWADYDGDGLEDYRISQTCLGGVCRNVTDAAHFVTVFTTDSCSRVVRVDYPDGTFEASTFNELGQRKTYSRKNGAIIAADFNYRGACILSSVSNLSSDTVPVPPTEFKYNGLGQCVSSAEGPSVVTRVFDSLGNKLSETQNGHTVAHTYNDRGCTGTAYPDGSRFSEVRNVHGQLMTLSALSAAGVALAPPIKQCAYTGFACVSDVSRNGVVTTRDFRSDGEPPLSLTSGGEDFSFGGCVRCTVTSPGGAVLEDHIIRRNQDQCETVHYRAFGSGSAPPSRRQTFTLNARNQVTGCLTQVRESAGGPVFTESEVRYVLDVRGRRLSAAGGRNPGIYSSSNSAPLFDDQMGQYSSWPGGAVIWRDDGDLAFLGRSTGGISLTYDGWSRLVGVTDSNGLPVASYAYDAESRRISSTLPGSTAAAPPVTTFFLYDGPDCIQELDGNGVPVLSLAVIGGVRHCISTKNGSTYYPNGGAGTGSDNGTAFVYPILPAEKCVLKEIVIEDPVLEIKCRTAPPPGTGPRDGFSNNPIDCAMLTNSAGLPQERFAFDDGCQPIFLNSDGRPIPGAASSSTGYRWILRYAFAGGRAWCPESGLYQGPDGVYSPELGQPISVHKDKPKGANGEGKKEFVGHVSLLK